MVKHKKLIWGLLMITLAVTSCSKGNDDVTESGLRYDMSKPNYEKPTTTIGFTYMNFVAYYGFPLMEIMKKIAPDVNVAKITYDMRVGGLLPADEALLLQTIVAHGDNNCIQTYVAEEYLCEGISDSSLYLVLKPANDNLLLYLPFVVTTDQGKLISVTATVHPNYSKAVLKTDGTTFTSTLTLTHIEYKEVSELDEVTKEMKLEPEMKLKYISIKRIEYPLSGN